MAKQIWAFYEDYAGPEDHFLPPDNVQIDPFNGVAHRTSPTNIGFLLTAAVAAREFGFIEHTRACGASRPYGQHRSNE